MRWLPALALVAACGSDPEPGKVVVAVTIDWEGAELAPAGLDALAQLRTRLGDAPLTHFVSAAYFTKPAWKPTAAATLGKAIRPADELAIHLHPWKSLALASGVTPKLAPSFLTGTDEVLDFEDEDPGFDVDLDAYEIPELRAMLRTSRTLLAATNHPVSHSFRAGGYVGTPKTRQAIRDEGFAIDSSAADARQVGELGEVLPERLAGLWPGVGPTTQPYELEVAGGTLRELPIAAIADYATTAEIAAALDAAARRVEKDPAHDAIVVLAFHLETADDFAARIAEALQGRSVSFTTVERAGSR